MMIQQNRSRFGAHSTATDVLAEIDLRGQHIVLTGGTSGIGKEAARALAAAGAIVMFTVRNGATGRRIAKEIRAETGNQDVHVEELDLMSIESVVTFGRKVRERFPRLNALILNAGIMNPVLERSDHGIESQFMTNYVGHLMLATILAPSLVAAAPSRIVTLTSSGHKLSQVNFEDINFDTRPYDGLTSYGQSKTASSLLAVELNRRLRGRGVLGFAVHPGVILDTNLSRYAGGRAAEEEQIKKYGVPRSALKTVGEGASTTVWAAVSPELVGSEGGLYLEDCGIAEASESRDPYAGVLPYALDPSGAQRTWELTERMLGLTFSV
jgi:NAD(P)-dependent dehydrogenase (short-subunit alcohol dehydrogenase family)